MSGLQFFKGAELIDVPSYVCNPLSDNTNPVNGDWVYYYYKASSSETIKITNSSGIPLNMCIFAQGGFGGMQTMPTMQVAPPSGYTVIPASPGGGGGGQVLNKTQFTAQEFDIELKPAGLFEPCKLKTITPESQTININQGYQGGIGQPITFNTSDISKSYGGMGGPGAPGGGAGGNAGLGGYILDAVGNTVYAGSSGGKGPGYNPNNTGKVGNDTANATLVNFADGTSGPVARAGSQGQSGNVSSGFLIYYKK